MHKPAQEDLRLSSCMLCASILSTLACIGFLNRSLAVLTVTLTACWSHWIVNVAYDYPGLQHPITPNPQKSAFHKKNCFLLGMGKQCVNPRHLAGRRLVNGDHQVLQRTYFLAGITGTLCLFELLQSASKPGDCCWILVTEKYVLGVSNVITSLLQLVIVCCNNMVCALAIQSLVIGMLMQLLWSWTLPQGLMSNHHYCGALCSSSLKYGLSGMTG